MNFRYICSGERWMLIAIAMLTGATLSLWIAELSPYLVSIPGLLIDSPMDLFFIAIGGALTGLALFEAIDFLRAFSPKIFVITQSQFTINPPIDSSKKCLDVRSEIVS